MLDLEGSSDIVPKRRKRNRGFDCDYFTKQEIDFDLLVKKANVIDLRPIHESMGISKMAISQYLSKKKAMSRITIPELFIDKVNEAWDVKMAKLDKVNKGIKNK
jgi:hypothetical protein